MKIYFWCCVFALLLCGVTAVAQNPLGTVSNVTAQASCPQGYFTGMQCFQATVSCPSTENIQVTFGYADPVGQPRGTVFFHDGAGGTTPYGGQSSSYQDYLSSYLSAGFQIVQMSWASDWENVGSFQASIGKAACRPATLMQYIYQNVHTSGAMCAQGVSAGSAAIAYALAWYNAASYLDKVELISGPVFGNIEAGCSVPKAARVQVCANGQYGCVGSSWGDAPEYIGGDLHSVRKWVNNNHCLGFRKTSDGTDDGWTAMSVVTGTSSTSFSYPNTGMAGWLCSNGLNNSAAEGNYYYVNFTNSSQTSSYSLTRIDGCQGPETIEAGTTPSGENGFTAVVNDMTDTRNGCVLHH